MDGVRKTIYIAIQKNLFGISIWVRVRVRFCKQGFAINLIALLLYKCLSVDRVKAMEKIGLESAHSVTIYMSTVEVHSPISDEMKQHHFWNEVWVSPMDVSATKYFTPSLWTSCAQCLVHRTTWNTYWMQLNWLHSEWMGYYDRKWPSSEEEGNSWNVRCWAKSPTDEAKHFSDWRYQSKRKPCEEPFTRRTPRIPLRPVVSLCLGEHCIWTDLRFCEHKFPRTRYFLFTARGRVFTILATGSRNIRTQSLQMLRKLSPRWQKNYLGKWSDGADWGAPASVNQMDMYTLRFGLCWWV